MIRLLGRLVVPALAFGLSGCPGGPQTAGAPEDIIYEYGTTDEVWVALDERPDIVDDGQAPELTAPLSPIPRDTPATFEWTPGAVATAAPRAQFRSELASLLLGRSVAYAHGTPYTGPLYRLIISVPGGDPVRVLTGMPTYTPTPRVWARITAATGSLTVEVSGAYARVNRIEEGPYLAATPATVDWQ